jgi:hypothetical protein
VPRKKSPDARDITMSARFSETEAAAIDAARGNTDRSVWLRGVALAAARASRRKPLPTDVITITADERMPEGFAAMTTSLDQPAAVIPVTGKCPHRIPPGAWCKTCGRTKT